MKAITIMKEKNVKQKDGPNIIVYILRPFKAPHISSAVQQERFILKTEFLNLHKYIKTRSLGALRAPTSSWWPFGPA